MKIEVYQRRLGCARRRSCRARAAEDAFSFDDGACRFARSKAWNVTQAEAAKRLSITQPRLNDLLKDRFNKFSLGELFDLATRAGLKVKLSIDETDKKKATKRAA